MIRRPPRSTRTDTLCPYTTLFRSKSAGADVPQRRAWGPEHGLQARRREHRLGRSARQQDDERNAVLSPDSSGQRAISQEAKSAIMDISELITTDRSEERRVGTECVSTCRSRLTPSHNKTNIQLQLKKHN